MPDSQASELVLCQIMLYYATSVYQSEEVRLKPNKIDL